MAVTKRLIDFFENNCKWCKWYRGKDDPVICDKEPPCLPREELKKIIEERRGRKASPF